MLDTAAMEARPAQRVTRLPRIGTRQIRPGDWIKIRDDAEGPLAGKIVRVKSMTCCVTERDAGHARWRLCVDSGLWAYAGQAERWAEPGEVEAAMRRREGR